MKRKILILGAAMIAIIAGIFIWKHFSHSDTVSWITAPVERGDLEVKVSASGSLSATNTVEVGTQVSGVIEAIAVDFNDQVKAGQIIAKLDIRNLKAALEQAEAAYLQAQVQVKQKNRAYALIRQYQTSGDPDLSVQEAQASWEQISAQATQARRNFERNKSLFEQGVIARAEFENHETEYERLQAAEEAAKVALLRARANVVNVDLLRAEEDLEIAKANLASMKAALERARINLDFAYIRAPIDGIVISRNVEVGQTVAASFQTPVLFTIANDLTQMEIEASIDEADIGQIKNGQAVNFTVDAYLDRSFEGQVEQIRLQPQIISNVVTYTVIARTRNDKLLLMPGMTANLDILTAWRKDILKVPVQALNFTPPEAYLDPWRSKMQQQGVAMQTEQGMDLKTGWVWMLNDENEPVPKKVLTGLNDGNFIEVNDPDIQVGDRVITGMNASDGSAGRSQPSSPFMPSRPGQRR